MDGSSCLEERAALRDSSGKRVGKGEQELVLLGEQRVRRAPRRQGKMKGTVIQPRRQNFSARGKKKEEAGPSRGQPRGGKKFRREPK